MLCIYAQKLFKGSYNLLHRQKDEPQSAHVGTGLKCLAYYLEVSNTSDLEKHLKQQSLYISKTMNSHSVKETHLNSFALSLLREQKHFPSDLIKKVLNYAVSKMPVRDIFP